MIIQKILFLIFLTSALQLLPAASLIDSFRETGSVEIQDTQHGALTYNALYAYFDELIEFLQTNPVWTQKLYIAKERFIRSKEKNYYSTDFFGFYDESQTEGRYISFYYSTHFHNFICTHYKEFNQAPSITRFLNTCREIQEPYGAIFQQAAAELGIETIFSTLPNHPPLLFKVIKYLSSYTPKRPHYDGTAFSLFLDSTDQSLLLTPYKSSFTVDDFSHPVRNFLREDNQNSLLLIPGTLLAEFSLYPTPHIVARSGKTRYATIAFAMRPNHIQQKNDFSSLPNFQD